MSEERPGLPKDVVRAAYGLSGRGQTQSLAPHEGSSARGSLCGCLVFQVVGIAVKSTVANEHEDSAGLHKVVEGGAMLQPAGCADDLSWAY